MTNIIVGKMYGFLVMVSVFGLRSSVFGLQWAVSSWQ